MAHSIDDSDYFTDTWSEQMLVNHNIYTYHRYSIDACDLVFSEKKKNHALVPTEILEMAELIERYFVAENAGEIEGKLAVHPFNKSISINLTHNQRRYVMKSYDELKAEMEAIQQQMIEAKKTKRANALKELKRLCKEFGFTAGMLKGELTEEREKA